MATSGTVAFRPDVQDIITEAFERCGLDPQVRRVTGLCPQGAASTYFFLSGQTVV
jgi:hypothetical protein